MKKYLIGAALAVASLSATAQVSITVGQPGFYGRVDLGNFAPAPVVYGAPVIASGGYYSGAPVYLRVPPGHRRNWSRYCGRYGACGQRVLFVRDDWYLNSYAPRYREHYGRGGPGWRDGGPRFYDGRGHGGPGRGPDRGDWHGPDRGHGGGHGGGPDRGHGGPGRGDGGNHGGHGGGGDHGGGHHGGGDRGR